MPTAVHAPQAAQQDTLPQNQAGAQPAQSSVDPAKTVQPETDRSASGVADSTDSGALWQRICEMVKPHLGMDTRMILDSVARGRPEGERFLLEVKPGFYYGRFNRPDVLEAFSDAASAVTGNKLTAILREWKEEPREPKSLDELRKFPEGRFVSSRSK